MLHRSWRGSTSRQAARVSSASYTVVRDNPVTPIRLLPPAELLQGLVDERGAVPQFPEHRPQRMPLSLPATTSATNAASSS